ncbi:MAG: ketol-acid reductoisomerase [candidate division Zixibacteria bacterium CG_4_9_14_3_um_filter_46_8]|nr:MAG: ketol-acid reductoisomerase [candidate division Zixibacteria bacterium CG_4_9_14_3_um_filter_46_8]
MAQPRVYYERDADLTCFNGKTVAVIGFGSQGQAQAMNLRDSGIDVILGLPSSHSRRKARQAGFKAYSTARATAMGDIISFLFPDQKHQEVFETDIAPNLSSGKTLMFAHGLSVHFKLVQPPGSNDVVMIAPHAPGTLMRKRFVEGKGVACFLAVYSDYTGQARSTALAYAKAIGCTRSAVFETTFEDEAIGDIFGEQAALCGGLSELLESAFETLVLGGLSPWNAYLECVQQLDLIAELIKKDGISGMFDRISRAAEYGSYSIKGRIVNDRSRRAMLSILDDIKRGKFVKKMMKDYYGGSSDYHRKKKKQSEHPINQVGVAVRSKILD